tara:strand:+ start:286 stop:558 length:273 start_codon:yes stop_codon:yes gene_type:complete
MVITTDFNIFADKYHNRQHLPNDIINMIMNINTETIKNEKFCNGVCCKRRLMNGTSWWKYLGFNSPCKCAYNLKNMTPAEFKEFNKNNNY